MLVAASPVLGQCLTSPGGASASWVDQAQAFPHSGTVGLPTLKLSSPAAQGLTLPFLFFRIHLFLALPF